MFQYHKHKKLVQTVALAFTIQCLGGSFTPVVSYAAETDVVKSEADTAAAKAKAEAEANYTSAKASEETIKAALGGIIELKDEDDDLQYVNKVYSLMTDSTGKTSQYDNLNALITAAEEEKKEADASGTTISENAQAILNMAERLAKISETAASGASTYTDSMKTNDIKTYKVSAQNENPVSTIIATTEGVFGKLATGIDFNGIHIDNINVFKGTSDSDVISLY